MNYPQQSNYSSYRSYDNSHIRYKNLTLVHNYMPSQG